MLRCRDCGATKDYLIEKEGKIECSICDRKWRPGASNTASSRKQSILSVTINYKKKRKMAPLLDAETRCNEVGSSLFRQQSTSFGSFFLHQLQHSILGHIRLSS